MIVSSHQGTDLSPEIDNNLDYKTFSYSTDSDPLIKRLIIRTIERLTGQIKVWRLYNEYKNEPRRADETFWEAACEKLELELDYDEELLKKAPETGPLVMVANHPYGVLDGLILCHLISKIRPDFKVLTNSVLTRSPEVKDHLLPIDFTGTPEALKTNLTSRKIARETLRNGGAIAAFPAGGVSNITRLTEKVAKDVEWQPFIGQLIRQNQATVLPVYFHGQNSRLFQIASLASLTLRLSLFFRELVRQMNTRIRVEIGPPVTCQDLANHDSPHELIAELREITYALGDDKNGGS